MKRVLYFRDYVEMPEKAWLEALKQDIKIVTTTHNFDIKDAVYVDIANGRDVLVNQHHYSHRIYEEYNSAKELINCMLHNGRRAVILDALETIPDDVAQLIANHVNGVTKVGSKYVFKGKG